MKNTILLKIKTENFKGLGDFEFMPKESGINIIYGDNGVGKSSLIKIFDYLTIIMENLKFKYQFSQNMSTNQMTSGKTFLNPYLWFSDVSNGKDIFVEIIVEMNGNIYQYGISLNRQNHITNEYLNQLRKQDWGIKKVLFSKKLYDNFSIDPNLLKRYKSISHQLDETNLNSFVSTMLFSVSINNNTDESPINLTKKGEEFDVVKALSNCHTLINVSNHESSLEEYYSRPILLLPFKQVRRTDKKIIDLFKSQAKTFEDFVVNIDKKILGIKVLETLTTNGKYTILTLGFKQKIGGIEVVIPYEKMSSGTQDYLKYLRLITLIKGNVPESITKSFGLFDEFGLHLHPSLTIKILNYVNDLVIENGTQIIITSHQALLLDKRLTKLKNKNKLIMLRDEEGKVKIKSLKGVGNRENNFRNFIQGEYGGNALENINPEESDKDNIDANEK